MSQVKNKNNKVSATRIAGGALVALSSFVPMPQISQTGSIQPNGAHAAKVTVGVTGKFITGITISNPVTLKFGKFVATAAAGNYGVKTDGGILANVEGKKVAGLAVGGFDLKIKVNAAVDVKFSKIGTDLTLAATVGAVGPTGSLTLSKIFLGKKLDSSAVGSLTLTTAGGTTAKQTNYAIKFAEFSGAGKAVVFGASVKWAGGRPVGAISNSNGGNIVLTIIY